MPKGFNRKAIEGFTKWMVAVLNDTDVEKNQIENTVNRTRKLLNEGFPKVRT